MNAELLNLYKQFRKASPFMLVGHNARLALDSAKTLLRFRELEADGLVRLRCEPEEEAYDPGDMLEHWERNGHPVPRRQAEKELNEMLNNLGVWWTCTEWRPDEESEWRHADSCGMHSGYNNPKSPFENCYVIDEMAAAVDAYENYAAENQAEQTEAEAMACRDIQTI